MQMNCFRCDNSLPVGDLFYCKDCNEISCNRCLLKNHVKHDLAEVLQNCLPALTGELIHDAKFVDAHDPTVKSLMSEVANIKRQINSIEKVAQQYVAGITKSHTSDIENSINEGTLTLQQFDKYRGIIKKNKDELLLAAAELDKETEPLTDSVSLLRDKLYDLNANMGKAPVVGKSPGLRAQETILLGGTRDPSPRGDPINSVIALQNIDGSSIKCFHKQQLAMKTARKWHRSVAINGSIITMGGQYEQYLSSVECTDLTTYSKYDLTSMIHARSCFAAGVIGNRIYVCGGYNNNSMDLCEYYDTETKKWNQFQSMIISRWTHCGATLNGILYAVDGRPDGTVESYNPSTNKWTMCPSLNKKRRDHRCSVLEGQIYVCGGANAIKSCECYDPRGSKWNKCADMNQGRCAFGLVAAGGRLYAIGGGDNVSKLFGSVEMYDPRNDKWTITEGVIEPLNDMSAVVI